MVQKASGSFKSQGRPPKFDREAVISAAIDAFWDNGLEATSLPAIEAATGVDRSTLYNSFGGKTGLYELATAAYLARAESWLFAPLFEGTEDGFSDITTFLERLKGGLTTTGVRPGCLIVNDMAASPDKRPSERYQKLLETGLDAALTRSKVTPKTRGDHRAGLIASAVIGINLMSRAGRSSDHLGYLVDSVIVQVNDWR